MGKAPKLLPKVLIGRHTLTLRQQGYADAVETVNIEEGKMQSVSITMRNAFAVTLSCSKKDAHIFIRKKGDNDFLELGVGSWQGELVLGDYEAVTSSSECTDGSISFAVVSNSDNRITLNAPRPKFAGTKPITVKGVTFNMIMVKGGTFTMGGTLEQGSYDGAPETPAHRVTLSDYYIGETEVTQELWQAVMGSNPSYFKNGNNLPVEQVSWNDCKDFIERLNSLTGMTFRLPTEAEWEYAARGGNKSRGYKYAGSNTLQDVAWFADNAVSSTHPVATKQPNELGIYDMSGNVWEWCQDWYGSYQSYAQTNPQGALSDSNRVLRGGSWISEQRICRLSGRRSGTPDYRNSRRGFRLVLVP